MGRKLPASTFFRRGLRMALCVLLAGLIGTTVYAGHAYNRHKETPAEPVPEVTAAPAVEESPLRKEFTARKLKQMEEEPAANLNSRFGGGEIVNLLLVGLDADSSTGTRSDTMILCTFNKQARTITMTSFLRDLYVKIPGYGKDRINAAYNFGGMELLNATIKENFGLDVHGSVKVDFESFEQIVDLLGGVTLDLTEAEANYVNRNVRDSNLQAGENLLTGKQALAYARNRRDTDGDFSRTNRQRKLLGKIIQTYKDKSKTQMLGILKKVAPMVTTDISKADLTLYALTLYPMLSEAEIRTQAIPVAGGYYDAKIDGKAVLVPDMEKNMQVLQEMLAQETPGVG